MHHTEIQVRIRFICRVPLSGVRDRRLSFADKSHVLGTVHYTNNGHLSLSNRLSGNVTKTRKINYSFISYNICISTDSEMDRSKAPTELNGILCCSRM